MNIQNKSIVITGGSDGLGLSLAKLIISKGSIVHIIGRNQERLDKAKTEINSPNVFIHQGDVSNYSQISDIYNQIGNIDILINNAGVWIEGQVVDNSPEQISSAIDINLKGLIYSTKAVLPTMITKNDGVIFNISSTSGIKAKGMQSVYVASKYGVKGFTESLEQDLEKTNIKVFGFYPGGMATGLFSKSGNDKPNSDWMDTSKVAEIIIFMIERDDSLIMNHVVLNKRQTKTSN